MSEADIEAELAQRKLENEPMSNLAHAPEQTAVVAADAPTIMAVIAKAAGDPNTDVDKLSRLMDLYERISDRNAKAAYLSALAEMQPQLPEIEEAGGIKNRDGDVQSTYALWEDVNRAVKPILHEHGFAISFRVGSAADGRLTVTGVLSHREGHQEETTITLPHDSSGSKNAVQAVGSSTSYGKRYTAMALLNLTSRGEDDDGQAGGKLPSAHAARKSPMGERCAELRNEIQALEGLGACTAWGNARAKEISEMPKNWQEMLREDLRTQRQMIIDAEKS